PIKKEAASKPVHLVLLIKELLGVSEGFSDSFQVVFRHLKHAVFIFGNLALGNLYPFGKLALIEAAALSGKRQHFRINDALHSTLPLFLLLVFVLAGLWPSAHFRFWRQFEIKLNVLVLERHNARRSGPKQS